MTWEEFAPRLSAAAKEAGLDAFELYLEEADTFKAAALGGEIAKYASSSTHGLCFRAIVGGRMGYAFTEALDEDAVPQLIRGVKESAALCEEADEPILYAGDAAYPDVELRDDAGERATIADKLEAARRVERAALTTDPRITKARSASVQTVRHAVRMLGSAGLDASYTGGYGGAMVQALAEENGQTATGIGLCFTRDYAAIDPEAIGREAAEEAAFMLGAAPVATGEHPIVLERRAVAELLRTFSGVFSAENAQKGLSLLAGKLGETIAAPCVTILDDPLMPRGLSSRPFDDEGVASRRTPVVENGVLVTLLHNLRTARKDGVPTTGNASRASYASPVRVAPTNFYIEKGDRSFAALLETMGEGLVICELAGLHSGANAVSGDFSLMAKGYTVKGGKRDKPLARVTLAGNFFQMLRSVQAVADDLAFPTGGFGGVSLYVGKMQVAGK